MGVAARARRGGSALTLAGATAVCLLAAFALQTRGPLVSTIVAAIVIVVLERQVSAAQAGRPWRSPPSAGVRVRLHAHRARVRAVPARVGDSISAGLQTDPLTVVGGDFSEVENFVAP